MQSSPEHPQKLRDKARALADQATAPQMTLVLISIALVVGIGLGAHMNGLGPGAWTARADQTFAVEVVAAKASNVTNAPAGDSEQHRALRAVEDALAAVEPAGERSKLAAADPVDALDVSGATDAKTPITVEISEHERAVNYALASLATDALTIREPPTSETRSPVRSPVSAGPPEATANRADEAIPIDALPVHRPSAAPPPAAAAPNQLAYLPDHRAAFYSDLDAGLSAEPASLTIVTTGEISRGESLGTSLKRQGITPSTVHLIDREMSKVFDFRRSRPGDTYRLTQDTDGQVLDFRYSQSEEESYYLAWEGTRYTVEKETAELHAQIAKIAGVVESSFYGAVVALGEQSALASDFARIFAWDIDFSRNVHPGDEFSILYERLYRRGADGRDVYVRPGRILAGRYAGKAGANTVVYFEDEDGEGAYFRPDGTSVERAFLAAPLEFSRITSHFTRARRHPILKITRPHRGIDYAAPHGTPVYSVAEGVVEYRARAGASGNLVRIRHSGGYTSHYAHLSRFEKSLKVGDRVEQRQVIGYVGSSGLSTGPHVCFRVKKDGRYVDPMKISSPAGAPIDREHLPDFLLVRDQLLASLGPKPVSIVDDAL